MSEMPRRMDSSGLTPFPNLDTTSMLWIERDLTFYKQRTWTPWEGGLLLLVMDWYSGGESVASNSSALWVANEDRISVRSVFCKWAVFLNDRLNVLEPSRILAKDREYAIGELKYCWQLIITEPFRKHAVAALLQKILPLKETLEAEFDVKICYMMHDKLPGFHNKTYSVHVNDGTWGQYKVEFPALTSSSSSARAVWQDLAEKRKERERLYDLALRQTNHVLGLSLPVVDLWDPGLQQVFGSMRRETETETEMETNTNRVRQPSVLPNAYLSYPLTLRGGFERDHRKSRKRRGSIRKP
ncbi:hypothetical protein BHYA_0085g00270 [Botrytis hyacinthi]|uniref:Uncharacterized protein n=1 Tax=Botrytis hyacinthi TaxID=278943 RepID=A0A4Z1GRY8_9HELO|nr:hypothetical protein BHYA_0085g00270 [Botrytis hyacinthi]